MEDDLQYVKQSTRLNPHARLHAHEKIAVALALVSRATGVRLDFFVTMCLVKSLSCLIWAQEVGVRYIAADVHSGVSLAGCSFCNLSKVLCYGFLGWDMVEDQFVTFFWKEYNVNGAAFKVKENLIECIVLFVQKAFFQGSGRRGRPGGEA